MMSQRLPQSWCTLSKDRPDQAQWEMSASDEIDFTVLAFCLKRYA